MRPARAALVAFCVALYVAGCSPMPRVAPRVDRSDIPVRNEISRVWGEFTAGLAEGRTEETWTRLSARLRREEFHGDAAAFTRLAWGEREGLFAGARGSWLLNLDVGWSWAEAKPEGMENLRTVRFLKEGDDWRIDGWTPVPHSGSQGPRP